MPDPEAARITANATIEAARIAADAARTNALIGAAGTLVAVVVAVITAYSAYRNARIPVDQQMRDQTRIKNVLKANLGATVRDTIKLVGQTLETYEGPFTQPVEVRVLPLPDTIQKGRPKDFIILEPEINEAIALVGLSLNDYRRAKEPIQARFREQETDTRPVTLATRPPDFDSVIAAARAYNNALKRLESLLR